MRRTDHSELAKKNKQYTTDSEFQKFLRENDTGYLYLAADNYRTQEKYLQEYSERIKSINLVARDIEIDSGLSVLKLIIEVFRHRNRSRRELRNTSLEDAIIDLYMCVYANKFMGFGYSSFSNFITYMREV